MESANEYEKTAPKIEQNQCNQYPPFPDNRTRADYNLGSNEREMASLVVAGWGARVGILYAIINNCALDPKACEAQLRENIKDLDFAIQSMEDWKEFRKTC